MNSATIRILTSSLIFLSCLTLQSCKEQELIIGQEKVIESSKKKQPQWVLTPPKESIQNIYFVGTDTSYIKTERYAYQMALKQLHEFITIYSSPIYQQTKIVLPKRLNHQLQEEFIDSSYKMTQLKLQSDDIYWEKIERLSETGTHHFYRIHLLTKLPKKILQSTTTQILSQQESQYQSTYPSFNKTLNTIKLPQPSTSP